MIQHVWDIFTLGGGYNTNLVLLGSSCFGLAAGVVGVFALLRKRALMSDALSHATLPGIAGGFMLAGVLGIGGDSGKSLPVLLTGAAATGVLGILCVHAITRWSRIREDAAIGIVLGVFFGAGIVLLSDIQNHAPAGSGGLHHFIFGQAAAMLPGDVMRTAGAALLGVVVVSVLFKEMTLVCFNEGFAAAAGWRVPLLDVLMMGLIVLVTVVGLMTVGMLMVVAMLVVPPVTARLCTDRIVAMTAISGLVGAASGLVGTVISAAADNLPTGAVIVLTSGVFFVAAMLFSPSRGLVVGGIRHARFRLRVAGDHLLELAHDSEAPELGLGDIRRAGVRLGWARWAGPVVVRGLIAGGMAERTPGGIRLTGPGERRGARISRSHALWSAYLVRRAEIDESHVGWSVDQVEHVLSEEMLDELERRLAQQPAAEGGAAP